MSPSAFLSAFFAASPLRHGRFRLFYLGSVATALGYAMQATVAAWLMATLTPSPLMVALVQTASAAPALVFGLVAGALADIVDRRKLVLVTHGVLLAATLALGGATLAGAIGPLALLALTFVTGSGFAFYLPAQLATINDLVPRAEMPRAVALGAVAFNVARAVGPALAGALAAWLGSGSALLASALFFLVMVVALRRWQSPPPAIPGVPETLFSGIRSGLRYVRHSAPMRALVLRSLSFSVCASALWALLPVVARDQYGLGAGGFGAMFGCFGVGAVAGALSIPRHLQRRSLNRIVTVGALVWAASVLLIAATPPLAVALVGTAFAGAAWVGALASLSAGIQSSAPAWVRARAGAMYLISVQASLALGSVPWGWAATTYGTPVALAASAGLLAVLLALHRGTRVSLGEEADVTTGVQLPDLTIAVEPMPDDGPVLIQVEYRVDPENHEAFLRAIRAVEPIRRRNGANAWRVFRDLEQEGTFVERFVLASWAEYLRLRARLTVRERELQDRVTALLRADAPMRISRLIGVRPPRDDADRD